MKSLNAAELVSYCAWLRERLLSAQLQDLWTDGETLVFQFYRQGEIYVVISLAPAAPLLWIQKDRPSVKKSPKPVSLFLSSHARNLVLRDLHVVLAKGRSLLLSLSARDKSCEVEVELIPKNPNLSVSAEGKKIWWNKPKDLPPPILPEIVPVERDWEEWCREVQAGRDRRPATSSSKEISSVDRALAKKQKALEALSEQVASKESERYRRMGEDLKGSVEIRAEWRDLYDSSSTPAENRERAFQKAKEIERKRQGTLERIEVLKKEIEKLRRDQERGVAPAPPTPSLAAKLMKKSDAQGRKLTIDGFEAVIGKSGADNLAILRQARAWDLWIHLKDEPGAHAILFRNRDQDVPPAVIQRVAEWVWSESRGKKSPIPGGKYEVLAVECRFVKPIKGDRLGRVTYRNPQVYTFASKPTS